MKVKVAKIPQFTIHATLTSLALLLITSVVQAQDRQGWQDTPLDGWDSILGKWCGPGYNNNSDQCAYQIDMHGWTVAVSRRLPESEKHEAINIYSQLYNIKYAIGMHEEVIEELQNAVIFLGYEFSDPPADPGYRVRTSITGRIVYYSDYSIVYINLRWDNADRSILLHELAHHWDRFKVTNESCIELVYDNAMSNQLYDSALRHYNSLWPYKIHETHRYRINPYVATNPKEYFAETSVSYWFSQKEVYPFNRYDLYDHDELGYTLMNFAWDPDLLPQLNDYNCD